MPVFLLLAAFGTVPEIYLPPKTELQLAHERRVDAIKSFEVVCRLTEIVEPGAYSSVANGQVVNWLPTELQTRESGFRIILDGLRMRLECGDPEGTDRLVRACDGTVTKEIDGALGQNSGRTTQGWVRERSEGELNSWASMAYHPLLSHCGRENWWGYPHGCVPTGRSEVADGGTLIEYAHLQQWSDTTRCWVDPGRDHTIRRLRIEDRRSGRVLWGYTVRHARHEPSGLWMPDAWEYVEYGYEGDRPPRTFKVAVTKLVVNGTWSDSEFDLTFPPGLRVRDQRTDTDHTVQADGTFGPYTPPAPKLVADAQTPPSDLPPGSWWSRNLAWMMCVVLSVGVVVLLWVRWARRKASRGPSGPG